MNKVIQNYVLLQKIGSGQYGNVYRSENRKTKQYYAVKSMNVQKFKTTPKLSEFTNNEITILSKINHPNIIQFIEMLRTANNYYLVYEYCNGGTLSEYIRNKKRLTEPQALKIFQQLRSAFQQLNAENILHRDLKPTNILFHNGVIKVADFGFCKELMKETDMTQTMVGSPIYMAPEVLKGLIYDARADIWSMGVILYEMLYGVCPYEESSIPKLVTLIDNTMLRFNPGIKVSESTRNLIKRMLTIKYRDRISPSQLIKYQLQGISTVSGMLGNNSSHNFTGNGEQIEITFKNVCPYIRKNLLYLSETIELLSTDSDDILYLRLCYLTYKILFAFMKQTNSGSTYWEMLKIQIPQERWQYIYQNQAMALKPFAEMLRGALMKVDADNTDTRIQMETMYLQPKYYLQLIEKLENKDLRERLLNCLLIDKHFINILERKMPNFTDYVAKNGNGSYEEKIDVCSKFAKIY